ncbi:hypothetical protein Tco_0525827 [Tanacetum coccineum]
MDKAQKERQKQEEATSAALAKEFDEIQARIDADHELAIRLTHEEKKTERAEAIRNKPPTRTQVRNMMITYLKHMVNSKQKALKENRADYEEESSKKQKLEEGNDAKKEELRDSIDVVPRVNVAIDVESLATKISIAYGRSKNYKILSEMLDDFNRQDVIDLHRSKDLFEPNEEDEIWKNQQDYNLISWRLFDSCGVHVLLMNTGVAIHMMIEKKYPLTQEMLSRMLNRRLEVDYESEMAFELLRFTRSQL